MGGQTGGSYDVVARLIDATEASPVVADSETISFYIGSGGGPGTPDRFETNGADNPTLFGSVFPRIEYGLSIHNASDEDYYNITLPRRCRVGLFFDHAQGDLDLELYWPQLQTGFSVVIGAARSATDNELWRSNDFMESMVTLRVFGKNETESNPDYDLFAVGPFSTPTISGNLAFGDLPVGSNAERVLTIRNNDSFEDLVLSGSLAPFGFTCSSWTGAIPPGASWDVPVTFDADLKHDYSGNVRLGTSPSGNLYIPASGRGVQSEIRLSTDLAFGDVEVGVSTHRTLTISNDGNESLTVSAVTLPSGFHCGWSGAIEAGDSNQATVVFLPTKEGRYTGEVEVVSDADVGDGYTHVSGNGVITLSLDSDGDGMCDAYEFIAGTISTDAASFFCAEEIEILDSNRYAVSWKSVTGRTYHIFESADLLSDFVLAVPNIACSPPTNRTIRAFTNTPLLIRLGVQLNE